MSTTVYIQNDEDTTLNQETAQDENISANPSSKQITEADDEDVVSQESANSEGSAQDADESQSAGDVNETPPNVGGENERPPNGESGNGRPSDGGGENGGMADGEITTSFCASQKLATGLITAGVIVIATLGVLGGLFFFLRSSDLKCGLSLANDMTKIIGGRNAHSGEFPFHVAIVFSEKCINCGGVMINDKWVLTAAHCMIYSRYPNEPIDYCGYDALSTSDSPERIKELIPSKSLSVSVGPTSKADVLKNLIKVKHYCLHEKYNWTHPKDGVYDIALIRTQKFLNESRVYFTSPACLPSGRELYDCDFSKVAFVTGFGLIKNNGPRAKDLQVSPVEIFLQNECQIEKYPTYDRNLMICAGVSNRWCIIAILFCKNLFISLSLSLSSQDLKGEHDTCTGDSGGALVVKSKSGHWVLVGITSFGDSCSDGHSDETPGTPVPGVYVAVAPQLEWIYKTIRD